MRFFALIVSGLLLTACQTVESIPTLPQAYGMVPRIDGRPPANIHEENEWISRVVQKGNASPSRARYALAMMHANATGVPRNKEKWLYWCTEAVKHNHPICAFELGVLKYTGSDPLIPQNLPEAVTHLTVAAQGGSGPATCYLGMAYGNGKGVVKDHIQALKFSEMCLNSAKTGPFTSAEGKQLAQDVTKQLQGLVPVLRSTLDPGQLAQVQVEQESWKKRYLPLAW